MNIPWRVKKESYGVPQARHSKDAEAVCASVNSCTQLACGVGSSVEQQAAKPVKQALCAMLLAVHA